MKRFMTGVVAALAMGVMAEISNTVTVTSFHQQYPYSGKATIEYTVDRELLGNARAEITLRTDDASATFIQENVVMGANTFTVDFAPSFGGALLLTNASYVVTIAEVGFGGVQLWANGPHWAECNVGAEKPEECGYYFWWGDTVGYTNTGSGWISVDDGTEFLFISSGTAGSTCYKKNEALLSAGYIDEAGNLVAACDAATAHLGSPWRMPTDADFSALVSNCTGMWTVTNGVYGLLVTGMGDYADRSIFLPAAGDGYESSLYYIGTNGVYWSSTPNADYSLRAWYLKFNSSSFGRDFDNYSRFYGRPVRPVRGFGSAVGSVTCDPDPSVVRVATPEITVAATFIGSKTKCEIACATAGARIFYTFDGSDPTSHSTRYAGAFYVTESCTLKAIAMLSGGLNSEIAEKTVTKEWTIGDGMGAPDYAFTTSGDDDKAFYRVEDASVSNGEAMHSGDIGNSGAFGTFARTVLSTTVWGPGTVSFSWKASCEDDAPTYDWDHGEFAVDGVVEAYVSGETDWTNVSVAVTGSGKHTFTWTYLKDDAECEGEDCIWVTGYGWASVEAYTHTTPVPVPYAWLDAHDPGVVGESEAYEMAAKKTAANGRKVWECYVLGLDPQVATRDFRIASFPMKADGTPDWTNVVLDPPKAQWNMPDAPVVWKGAATLEGPWQTVTAEGGSPGTARPTMRFFKAVVFGDAHDMVQH